MSSLLKLEHQQKDFLKSILNLHRLVLRFLSYSFGVQMTNTFIHSQSSLVNHTRFQTKRAKSIPVFTPKQCKNDILWGGTYLYLSYQIPLKLFIEAMDKFVNEDYQGQESYLNGYAMQTQSFHK